MAPISVPMPMEVTTPMQEPLEIAVEENSIFTYRTAAFPMNHLSLHIIK